MAHLEKAAAERSKEHADFLARHDEKFARRELAMQEFEGKLNAFIDAAVRRGNGAEGWCCPVDLCEYNSLQCAAINGAVLDSAPTGSPGD